MRSAAGRLPSWARISYSAYLYHLPLLLIANEYLVDAPMWARDPALPPCDDRDLVAVVEYVEQPFLRRLR